MVTIMISITVMMIIIIIIIIIITTGFLRLLHKKKVAFYPIILALKLLSYKKMTNYITSILSVKYKA